MTHSTSKRARKSTPDSELRSNPFKPLGYHGPHVIPEFGWRAWLRGAWDAYRGARRMPLGRIDSLRWVWNARP